MNRTLSLFYAADAASAALSGGQAPRSWRRECERRATRIRALGRAALWVGELSARAPGLTDTPLWGERLAELATRTPARQEETAARPRTSEPWPPARPAHTPAEANRARRQTPSRRTSAAPPPPLPRAFQPPPADAPLHDARFSDVNRPAPGLSPRAPVVPDSNGRDENAHGRPRMIEPGRASTLRPLQDDVGREQLEDGQGVSFNERQSARAPAARAGFNPPEVFTPSEDFSSSVGGDVGTRDGREAFVQAVEGLARQASRELLSRLAGRNGSFPVQQQKSPGGALSKYSGAATAESSATTPSRKYGAAPSLAEERRSPPTHTQAAKTPRTSTRALPRAFGQQSPRERAQDAPDSRGGRVLPPDAAALHTRGRQRWGLLAARTVRALRRSGVSPAAPGDAGAQLLNKQVFLTVSGETAPRDLLTRLAGGGVAASGAARKFAERSGGHQSSAPRASRGDTAQTFPDAGPNASTTSGGSAVLPIQTRTSLLDAKQLRASATAEDSAPGVNTSLMSVNNYLSDAETSTTGAAASPVVAESLPPLLPPPLLGMPILPIALATAREGARAESRETAEDLDALAAKIKLILDEEARRHGINL